MAVTVIEEDGVLGQVVHKVKTMYCDLRRQAQNVKKFWPTNEKWDKYWRGAAMICINNRIDPREFMEVQFYALKPWPDIPMISSASALERFMENRRTYAGGCAAEAIIQMDVFDRSIKLGRTAEEILSDPTQQFDSLFVYIMACNHNIPALVANYEDAALMRYATSVHYDGVYKELIPDRLKVMYQELIKGGV